jgi:hypothetical protein
MSEMLEQAIIDAEALKKAAAKNAETLVLEKYSNQIKEAVESLLEQEDPLAATLPAAPAGMDMGADPMAADPMAADPMAADPAAADPAAVDPAAATPVEKSAVLEHIPLAATSKDNEQVEIPLDKLMEELGSLNESLRFGGDTHNISNLFEHNLAEFNEDELQEVLDGLEEDEESLEEDVTSDTQGATDDITTDTEDDGSLEEPLEEDFDKYSDIFEEITESLVVDLAGANKGGWAATPESTMQLAEEEILAIEQDSKVREERAQIRKALKQLENVNESLNNKNDKLQKQLSEAKKYLEKFKDVTSVLKDKLQESNLTNAKLLYQNKALSSSSLNERQKDKLVEAVSNAESIEEARVIFETLQSTVGSTSRKSRPKSLSEAIEKPSSMILSAARRSNSDRQKENPTLNRWKTLAGIDN